MVPDAAMIRYISAGSGNGNPFGLGAVAAVCFPFVFFARLYWPVPPMTNIIFFVTAFLVRCTLGVERQGVLMPGDRSLDIHGRIHMHLHFRHRE